MNVKTMIEAKKKTIFRWFLIAGALFFGFKSCQETSMFLFAQGYYEGCVDSAQKDTNEGFRDFKHVSEMEKWCQERTQKMWDHRHDSN